MTNTSAHADHLLMFGETDFRLSVAANPITRPMVVVCRTQVDGRQGKAGTVLSSDFVGTDIDLACKVYAGWVSHASKYADVTVEFSGE